MASLAPTSSRIRPFLTPGRRARAPFLSTPGLARVCAHHPWRTLAAWLVVLALAVASATGLADVLTTAVTMTNEPESVQGLHLIEARFRPFEPATETIIVRSESLTVDDPAFRAVVEQTTAALAGLDGVVAGASNYYQAEAGAPEAEGLVSADRHTTLIPVAFAMEFEEATDHAEAYLAALDGASAEGFEVLAVGDVSADHTYMSMAEEDMRRGEQIGIPVAVVVLIIVFGALIAAAVPLLLAVVAIVVAFGLTALLGRAFDLSFFVSNVITMIGLAVGIDYSLFIVARFREERRRGASTVGAIELAAGTASKAVLFSGTTVVLALAGMLFVPLDIFRSMGAAAILVVVAAVAATLTLIPALLALLGDRIDWPRRRRIVPPAVMSQASGSADVDRGIWARVTHLVMARPVLSALFAVTLLGALAWPALDLERGSAGVESLPPSETTTAFGILAQDFSAGVLAPVQLVVNGLETDPALQGGLGALGEALRAGDAFGQPPRVTWNEAGDLALVEAQLAMDANSPPAFAAVDRLRETTIPAAFGDRADRVYVTGDSAFMVDYFRAVDDVTPFVFAFVLGLSFMLLMLAFRSLIVPLKAILLNLLSVGAAYGVLVLVFQKGYGADVLGFQQTPKIEAWLPIFLFCILFGLSMDYHVFLLSRIREHYDLTGRNRESVSLGLQSTAKVITGAALIMVVVFGGFAAGRLVQLQEMGFGLAVAVFLDATIVRSILVPAGMALLGNVNWYLPRWLRWLPDLRIEGQPAAWP
jgi:RND superfamily putative drug exporter